MTKRCIVCGKTFNSPPSSNVLTCSQKCSKKRRSELLTGREVKGETREKLSEKAKERGFTDNLKKGTPAARSSPKSGRFETNVSAKEWILLSPEGTEYKCRNLKNFIRTNPVLFGIDGSDDKAVERVAAGFRTIKGNILHSRRGQTYHGWTVEIQ